MPQIAVRIKERALNDSGNKLRRNGEIPAIIYGESWDKAIPVKVENSALIKLLRYNSKGSIIKLKLKGEVKLCVVKQVQKDTMTGQLIHVDFQHIEKNEILKMKIPVNYIGSENLKLKRLVLETFLSELEMQGAVEKIPEYLEIDVSQMNIEGKIFAKNINLPEEVKLITEPETLLAVVNG